MSNHELKLYVMEYCPYCHKVLDFMNGESIDIPVVDITKDAEAEAELIKVGGKRQCPCLFIDGKAMYESTDIINWLKESF